MKLIRGKNDLATKLPHLANQRNSAKNDGLMPCDVTGMSDKKVWWKCPEGHEWQATANNRSNGNGCPYCSGRLPIVGETDLATQNPPLAAEWHPTKNSGLMPCDVTGMSGKKVWWKCPEGHEWQATVNNRAKGRGCPFCSGQAQHKRK